MQETSINWPAVLKISAWVFVGCNCLPIELANASGISGMGTWETTLQARDLDGDLSTTEAFYDTTLNITWLANLKTIQASQSSWVQAKQNVTTVNFAYGTDGWRLPTKNGDSLSELAHLYYITLGNSKETSITTNNNLPVGTPILTNDEPGNLPPGTVIIYPSNPPSVVSGGLANRGNFVFSAGIFWTDQAITPQTALGFDFSSGAEGGYAMYPSPFSFVGSKAYYYWPVHDGDIGSPVSVPEPTTFGLMLLGLSAMAIVCRRSTDEKKP